MCQQCIAITLATLKLSHISVGHIHAETIIAIRARAYNQTHYFIIVKASTRVFALALFCFTPMSHNPTTYKVDIWIILTINHNAGVGDHHRVMLEVNLPKTKYFLSSMMPGCYFLLNWKPHFFKNKSLPLLPPPPTHTHDFNVITITRNTYTQSLCISALTHAIEPML